MLGACTIADTTSPCGKECSCMRTCMIVALLNVVDRGCSEFPTWTASESSQVLA